MPVRPSPNRSFAAKTGTGWNPRFLHSVPTFFNNRMIVFPSASLVMEIAIVVLITEDETLLGVSKSHVHSRAGDSSGRDMPTEVIIFDGVYERFRCSRVIASQSQQHKKRSPICGECYLFNNCRLLINGMAHPPPRILSFIILPAHPTTR